MTTRRKLILLALPLVVAAAAITFLIAGVRLRSNKQQRESAFISIHFAASEVARHGEEARPRNLEELLDGIETLMEPFPSGSKYLPEESSFTLEEPSPRRVGFFKYDRLVSTARKWPRWESSGNYAKKYGGQQVPPAGYEP